MALKDRLEARRQGADGASGDGHLTVIEGMRSVPPVPLQPAGGQDDSAQKSTRPPLAFAAVKGAIHEMLVERHADEIDITDRVGVKSRIASLAEEYARTASITLNRLDYGHLVDALLDEVLGLGPLQALLEDPATTEIMINHPQQIYVERAGRVSLSPIVFQSAAQLRQVIDPLLRPVRP